MIIQAEAYRAGGSSLIKVLFVCLGNICRSPMAEAIFRDLVKKEGLDAFIEVDSAGTGDWHVGKPPHEGTRRLLDSKQISYAGQVARQLTKEDLSTFDYILAMDEKNLAHIQQMQDQNTTGLITRLLDLNPNIANKDVPDPYYTGNFDEVYALLHETCHLLLDKIKTEHQLPR